MIYVNFDGLGFEKELLDIVKLYFKSDDICTDKYDPLQNSNGIFLSGEFNCISDKGMYEIMLKSNEGTDVAYVEVEEGQYQDKQLEEKKAFRWMVKRNVYLMLSKALGKNQPWGMLTGIRPTKMVHEMLGTGMPEGAVFDRLENYYMIDHDKAGLLYNVAAAERKILSSTSANSVGLYIGIPFCNTRCVYCSFTSNLISKHSTDVAPYIEALKLELAGTARLIKERGERIQSIYIGGGTPTSISTDQLSDLLSYIEDELDLSCVEEYTLEAGRPDSIDKEKLTVIKNSAVNRISINPQTMNAETLALIGRSHTPLDVVNKFELARRMGFSNINMDVIIGLPGETVPMFEHTLRELSYLSPDSLTVHTMAVKRASRLNEDKAAYELTDSDTAAEMIDLAARYATEMGMHPYYLYRQKNILGNLENIGYCKPGCESIYNVQIMEEKQSIFAVGAGATSKVVFPLEKSIKRAFNVKDISNYISRVDEMLERKRLILME